MAKQTKKKPAPAAKKAKPAAKKTPVKAPVKAKAAVAAAPVKAKAAVAAAPVKGVKKASATEKHILEPKKNGKGIPTKGPVSKKSPLPFEAVSDEEGAEFAEGEETQEEEEEDAGAIEGPPPWWRDDPAGIEGGEENAENPAKFDDSDEWSEEDGEEWGPGRRTSLEELEGGEEDDDRW